MNERVLELLIRARNVSGPGIQAAQNALSSFANRVRAGLRGVQNVAGSVTRAFSQYWLAAVAAVYLVQKAFKGIINIMRQVGLEASIEVENIRIRLRAVLGSVAEGNKVFDDMAKLAASVPKTYQEIMAAAADLSGVVTKGSRDIAKLMPIIVDISAATGIEVREVTGQIIRMYSAGAASADTFRERGVLAALGFKAGVTYSNKETMDIITKQWEDGTGKFVDAAKMLSSTWGGVVSMFQDQWFNFRRMVGEAGFFDKVKDDLNALLILVNRWGEEGKLDQWAKNISKAFEGLYDRALEFVIVVVEGSGKIVTGLGNIAKKLNDVQIFLKMVAIGWQHVALAQALGTAPWKIKGYLDNIKKMEEELTVLLEKQIELGKESGFVEQTERASIHLRNLRGEVRALVAEQRMANQEAPPTSVSTGRFGDPEEASAWQDKVQAAMEGTDAINTILEDAMELSSYAKELEKINFLRVEQEKVQAVIDSEHAIDIERTQGFERLKVLKEAEAELSRKLAIQNAQAVMTSTGSTLGSIAQLFEVAQGEGKKYAVFIKALRIAEAVMNTAAAVTSAMTMQPFIPVGMAAAISAGAMGAAQIATIAAQPFSKGTDSVPSVLTPGEMVIPRSFAAAIRSGDLSLGGPGGERGAEGVSHNYYIQAVDAPSFVALVQRNPEAIEAVVGKALKHNTTLRGTMRESIA
jgi:hypothetical protein